MNAKEFYSRLKPQGMSWAEFGRRTGFISIHKWRAFGTKGGKTLGYSIPPHIAQNISEFAKANGKILTTTEVLRMLLGEDLWQESKDKGKLISGTMTIDEWLKRKTRTAISQKKAIESLGLEESTAYHYRMGLFKRFLPVKAIEVVRRSGYKIDLWRLLGTSRQAFFK